MTTRRGFLTGLASFVAAPAIVRTASLMAVSPVRPVAMPMGTPIGWWSFDWGCPTPGEIKWMEHRSMKFIQDDDGYFREVAHV